MKSKQVKFKAKKLVMNVALTRYTVIKKIAKYDFNFFLSTRDMFAPLNGQQETQNGLVVVASSLARDPDDDYFDIFWIDGAGPKHIERFQGLKPHQRINHFPGMSIICKKNELGKLLNHVAPRFPGEFDFYPRTFVLPADVRKLELYIKEKQEQNYNMALSNNCKYTDPIFIVKPENGCQGRGIFLIKEYADIEAYSSCFSRTESNFNSNSTSKDAHDLHHCVV